MNEAEPIRDLKAHYTSLLRRFGANHQAVQWSSRETQERRFAVLCELIEPSDSVLDLGCGLGDLLGYLRNQRDFRGRYRGLDLVADFVEHARAAYANDEAASFREHDVRQEPLPRGYDVVVASGLFNNRLSDNWEFLTTTARAMFEAATKGVAFNALSTYVDYQDAGLYYCDPLALFDYAKRNLTQRVSLRHDYRVKPDCIPFEFSLYLLK